MDPTVLPDAPRGRETNPALTAIRRALSTAQDVRAGFHHPVYAWHCPPGNDRCPVLRDLYAAVLVEHPWPARGETETPDARAARNAALDAANDEHIAQHRYPDPDAAEIREVLDAFIASAQRWRRTGRPKKG